MVESTQAAQTGRVNVGANERRVSLLGGAATVLWGLSRGGAAGAALTVLGTALIYRGASGHCPLYARLGRSSAGPDDGGLLTSARGEPLSLHGAVTVSREPRELYAFWRDFSHLPQFMRYLAEVRPLDDRRSRWLAVLPGGRRVRWDAEITQDVPGELIAWRSLPGAELESEGEVRFRAGPEGRGSEVEVAMRWRPPGPAGAAARLVRGLSQAVLREDLRRFKQLMEAGEVPTAALVH